MSQTLRKFIGMILLVGLVVLYAVLAVTIATFKLADAAWWVHMSYFAISGLLWIVPAMFIIKWMLEPQQ